MAQERTSIRPRCYKSRRSQIEVKTIRLYGLDYKGCMSCMACKIKGKASNVCKFKDALTSILEEIALADGLVLGSPIYFGDVTGQTPLEFLDEQRRK